MESKKSTKQKRWTMKKMKMVNKSKNSRITPEPTPNPTKTKPTNNGNNPKNSKNSNNDTSEPAPKKTKITRNNGSKNGVQIIKMETKGKNFSKSYFALPYFIVRSDHARLAAKYENRTPLFISDLQHLLLYSQLEHRAPYTPSRWCILERCSKIVATTLIIVDNISLYDYESNESSLPFLRDNFDNKLEILSPKTYDSDLIRELSMVPLSSTQMKRILHEYGDLDSAVSMNDNIFDVVRSQFPIKSDINQNKSNQDNELPKSDHFPRTQLLLSGDQMIEENYPLPIVGLWERKYNDYELTKNEYDPVTPFSPMFGIDCEMCLTTIGDNELTRVSIVDEKLNTLYDTIVKPHNRIVNYMTRFSGITPIMMKGPTKRLTEVQDDLRELLPKDAILVGQSLSNDLHAIKMMHPYVIDTSIIFNLTGDRSRKTKLKILSEEFLNENIQKSQSGHCSTEDSLASMKLTQLKLKNSITFGDAVMGDISGDVQKPTELGTRNYATSLLKLLLDNKKSARIIGLKKFVDQYKNCFNKGNEISKEDNHFVRFIEEERNRDVFKKLGRTVEQNLFTICHIECKSKNNDDNIVEELRKLDERIQEVYDYSNYPALVIVLLAGTKNSNGVCFIKIKK